MLEQKLKLAPKLHQRAERAWCKFCRIAGGDKNEQIVGRNEKCVPFDDINPASTHHVLVIPACHIDSILDLSKKS